MARLYRHLPAGNAPSQQKSRSVYSNTVYPVTTADIHPDLRRIARVLPRTIVRATTLPLLRAAERLQKSAPTRSVEVLTTSTGVTIRLRTAAEADWVRRCCGSTAAVTSSALRPRMTGCAPVSPANWASRSTAVQYRPGTRTPVPGRPGTVLRRAAVAFDAAVGVDPGPHRDRRRQRRRWTGRAAGVGGARPR